jgi:hypothetical protein
MVSAKWRGIGAKVVYVEEVSLGMVEGDEVEEEVWWVWI